jgi:hypothetical protein
LSSISTIIVVKFVTFVLPGPHDNFVNVAPDPVFAGLEGLHDRMFAGVKVLCGVLVLGVVAAPYVAAGEALAQMYPRVA